MNAQDKQKLLNAEIENMESIYIRFLCVRKSHGFDYLQRKAEIGLSTLESASHTLESMGIPEFAQSLYYSQVVRFAGDIVGPKHNKIDDEMVEAYHNMTEFFYYTIVEMKSLLREREEEQV